MAYQSLYRRYRPQRFDQLVGQEHVTNALRNAVRDGRIGHAYLFSGPRGTGKTTSARILAKALNCTNLGADGEPDGECDNCRAIADGTFLDLFELDAASNRGVGDARDLLERIAYRSATGGRKVYILDEVHMLTDAAANTLLKSLEEPPEHVVFVLATTNPESVLPTIRSRTQHFEFTLLSTEQIQAHLADICAREGVEASSDALTIIARAGGGSVRDALSLLDQALAHGTGKLDTAAVGALFGGAPFELRARILAAIADEDAAAALVALGELLESGHEPRRVADDLLRSARDSFLLTAGAGRVRVEAPEEDQERLRELGESLGNAALVRVLETIGQAVVDMRGTDAADPRLVLEVALVRLSRRDAGPPLQILVERIERLERGAAGSSGAGAATAPAGRPGRPRRSGANDESAEIGDESSAPATSAAGGARPALGALRNAAVSGDASSTPEPVAASVAAVPQGPVPDLDDVIVAWGSILPELPMATRSAVQSAQPLRIEGGDVIVFGVAPALYKAARPRFVRAADSIREAFTRHLGRSMKFNLEAADQFSDEAAGGSGGSGGSGDTGGSGDAGSAETKPDAPKAGAPNPAPKRGSRKAQPRPSESAASSGADIDVMDDGADIDLSETIDVDTAEAAVSSVGMLEQHLGATVVEEVRRD